MQKPTYQTMRAARRRYCFYDRRNRGHVLENKNTGKLEFWRARPAALDGIRWRHTVLAYVSPYTYHAPIP